MGDQLASLKFAVIGHQENWEKVMQFTQDMRTGANNDELTLDKVKDVFGFIPPRKIFEINVNSVHSGTIRGAYIDTFIPPDELDIKYLRKNIQKVWQSCELCAELNVPIVGLGGFTSIVLESGDSAFSRIKETFFTTGNTLTAAFITKEVEMACALWDLQLEDANLLVIGSSGDIGSACISYFSGKVRSLLLNARNSVSLQKQSAELAKNGVKHSASKDLSHLVPDADIVICAASSQIASDAFKKLKPAVIVCDAGYPKNLHTEYLVDHERLFFGGMGVVDGGYEFDTFSKTLFYSFPSPNVSHGCVLEAIVLAMDENFTNFSSGRGNITPQAMSAILSTAQKHGIFPAPLFNKKIIDAAAISVLR